MITRVLTFTVYSPDLCCELFWIDLLIRVLKNFGDYFNLRACLASWLFVLEAAFGLKLVEFGVFDHKGVFG